MTVDGIDVSVYQNPTPSLDGLGFVIAKASEGTRPDPRYAQHRAATRAAGLVFGAYHYNSKLIGVAAQVAAFLQAAPDADLYALDVEGGPAELFTPADAAQFIAGMHAAGKTCGLYHSESGWFDAGQDWNWVANWSREPMVPWTFWQYRGSPLDLDRFNGTADQLRTLAGITTPEAPMPRIVIPSAAAGTFTTGPGGATVFRVHDGADGQVGAGEPQRVVMSGALEGFVDDAWFTSGAPDGELRAFHKSQGTFVADAPQDDKAIRKAQLERDRKHLLPDDLAG